MAVTEPNRTRAVTWTVGNGCTLGAGTGEALVPGGTVAGDEEFPGRADMVSWELFTAN